MIQRSPRPGMKQKAKPEIWQAKSFVFEQHRLLLRHPAIRGNSDTHGK
jgi:hypothetical protein